MLVMFFTIIKTNVLLHILKVYNLGNSYSNDDKHKNETKTVTYYDCRIISLENFIVPFEVVFNNIILDTL